MTDLPVPTTVRWQPLRAGLINIYRFDDEEFRFAGGRLLLRGNNGTGKTRALALLLPFLLDGEVRPARVEPDGNVHRRFEWHLLMDVHAERTGYAWLEFGRVDGEGVEHFCTIGCGMRAVEGHTGLRSRWFFCAPLRLGANLRLHGDDGTPLSREALAETLAGRASVHEQATAHRAAVDAALYGLGSDRYATLVDLLIELRRPQLTRDLDEERLSRALSDALPGLGRRIVDDVADGYRSLERDAQELAGLDQARQAVDAFAAVHRRHLAAEGAALADGVRQAQGRYEHAQACVRDSRAGQTAAAAALEVTDQRIAAQADERAATTGEERALRSSELMRSVDAIDRVRADAERAAREAAARRIECAAQETRAAAAQARQTEAGRASERAATSEVAERASLAESCRALGIDPGEDVPLQRRARLRGAIGSRREASNRLRQLDREREVAAAASAEAVRAAHTSEGRRDAAQLRSDAAGDVRQNEADSYCTAVETHRCSLAELHPDPTDLAEAVLAWCAEPDGASPYEEALTAAAEQGREDLARQDAALTAELATNTTDQQALRDEQARLRSGADLPPPAPPWRNDSARSQRPGAALWRLCDFRSDCPEQQRAGIEAALQAAGLLDAWVTPDGALRDGPDGEAYLVAGAPPAGCGLDRLLQPAVDAADAQAAAVPLDRVRALLAAIGNAPGDGVAWVTADGAFANGLLRGAWSKPTAAHLGAGARATARRERLEAIAAALAALAETAAGLAERRQALRAASARLAAELAARPDPAPLRRAHAAAIERRHALAETQCELAAAQTAAALARELAASTTTALTEAARIAGLAAWSARLDALAEAIHNAEHAALRWWNAAEQAATAAQGASHAAALADEAATARGEIRDRAQEAERHATGLAAERAALEAAVGVAVAELLARLAALRQHLSELGKAEDLLRADRDLRLQAVARAGQAAHDAEGRLTELTAARAEALIRLRQVAAAGLLAGLGADWRAPLPADASDTAVVAAAGALQSATAGAESGEEARDRLASQVNERFQQLHLSLSAHDLLPIAERHHGIMAVRVPFRGAERGISELAEELAGEVAQRRQLLTANERKLVENFLIDQAADHLHGLLFAAEAWVATVNRELASRPTQTGMALRFRWLEAEQAPEDLEAARRVLLRPQHAWSGEDRSLLAGFLQRCIAAEHERDAGAAWGDCLAAALDYRRWHRFAVERQQGGRWTRLTKRTHGTGSGGEKALALTLPMFAAAAAHYAAAPLAPRLILLDEAFVGIDQEMRRQCMGLLAAFDLDVVMTSEREWGCYDTVPAIAICQLAADPGGGCVAVTRYVWNGRERRQEDA
jgi:uncharacterized protein (TIGR02680 family)